MAKHGVSRSLRIQTIVTELDHDQPTDLHFKDTTWIHPSALTVECLGSDDQARPLYWSEKRSEGLSVVAHLLLGSLVGTNVQKLSQLLKALGVPIVTDAEAMQLKTEVERRNLEVESLTRWNGSLAWEIGKQLWFEKDSFIPLRMLYSTASDGQEYDFRFEGTRLVHDFYYPKTTKLYRKNAVGLMSQLVEISIDPEGPKLKVSHLFSAATAPFSSVGDSASSSLKRLMQLYYGTLR
jgi:hypothetical protein